MSWLPSDRTEHSIARPILDTNTVGRSTPGSATSAVSGLLSQPSLLHSSHALDASVSVLPPMGSVCVDLSHGLHPFSGNRFDAGLVHHLASIVHAFNYRVAVLWDGAKPALRTGRSQTAERGFLENASLPKVAVMFQILSVSPRFVVFRQPYYYPLNHGDTLTMTAVSVTVYLLIAEGLTFMRCQLIILLVTVSRLRYYCHRM